jgi:hypothetical protein
MLDVVATKILESAAQVATSILGDAVKRENSELLKKGNPPIAAKLIAVARVTNHALAQHVQDIRGWAVRVRFADLKNEKSISSIYVELNTYLMPLSSHQDPSERLNTKPLFDALSAQTHAAIIGGPGAGKTTSIQKICVDYFRRGKALHNYNFPIFVRLRDLSTKESRTPVMDRLQNILGISISIPSEHIKHISAERVADLTYSTCAAYVNELQVLILLDGYDEIPSEEAKSKVNEEIQNLARSLQKSKIIITSRSGELKYRLADVPKFEIAPLSSEQISIFAHNWLADKAEADDFLRLVMNSPFADTAIRPLTVAHLCAIYERLKTIPDKPRSIYRKVVNLLLEEWDAQREISRLSKYAGFDQDRKFEFLSHVAYVLTIKGLLTFSHDDLRHLYGGIHFEYDLPANQAANIAKEIESHNGLIIESGYKQFEFAHKSLQEFLTADYLVRLPHTGLTYDNVGQLANELAIATALSSRPVLYFVELVMGVALRAKLKTEWYRVYISRLALEKADLTSGYNPDALLATLIAIASLQDTEQGQFLHALSPMIQGNVSAILSKYYDPGIKNRGFVQFRFARPHSRFKLPESLRVLAVIFDSKYT